MGPQRRIILFLPTPFSQITVTSQTTTTTKKPTKFYLVTKVLSILLALKATPLFLLCISQNYWFHSIYLPLFTPSQIDSRLSKISPDSSLNIRIKRYWDKIYLYSTYYHCELWQKYKHIYFPPPLHKLTSSAVLEFRPVFLNSLIWSSVSIFPQKTFKRTCKEAPFSKQTITIPMSWPSPRDGYGQKNCPARSVNGQTLHSLARWVLNFPKAYSLLTSVPHRPQNRIY